MLLVKREGSCYGVTCRCPRKGCRKELALRGGTFFEGSHLSLLSILRIIHLWSTKTPVAKTISEFEVTDQSAVDWYNFIRDVCAQYFLDHPKVIGGPGEEVEIDESHMEK
ncbi:hypothetical protein EMCRGX_G017506 [Ephydatia muelleri]